MSILCPGGGAATARVATTTCKPHTSGLFDLRPPAVVCRSRASTTAVEARGRTGGYPWRPRCASIIPGLLHTTIYAAALIGVTQVSPLHHARVVDFREVRQQRLLAEHDALSLAVVIDEHALDRPVGGPGCMRDQLEHLLAMATRDNITVQVMPDSVPVHDGLAGTFMLLDFGGTQSIGYVAYPDGAAYVPDYRQVAGYHYRREQLNAAALDEVRSREVIKARRDALLG